MSAITAASRAQWEKVFPPIQQRALRSMNQIALTARKGVESTAFSATSSTTLTADTDLVIPNVPAGIVFAVTGYLITTMAAAGNLKFDFSNSTCTVSAMSIQTVYSVAAGTQTVGAIQTALNTGSNGGTSNQYVAVSLFGTILLATPGSLGMTFAQQASSATATTVGQGSYIYLESLDPVLST